MGIFPDLGHFKAVTLLHAGPLTRVFRGVDLRNRLPCVIKVVRCQEENSALEKLALGNEINILQRALHPAFPKLLGFQLESRPCFIALEMIPGANLRDVLRSEFRLAESQVATIIRQILDALIPLHRTGRTHGDIKPDNILLEHGNRVRLIDFGYSTPLGDIPFPGVSLPGTPNYMAPEICAGNSPLSFAADLFSLGVTAFEMLTGYLPYPSGTLGQTLERHQSDPLAGRLNWRGLSFSGLDKLVEKMLSFPAKGRGSPVELLDQIIGLEIQLLGKKPIAV
ncbi:MAG: serine/threonine protein kinase [Gemmataceae bacterium]|nr:serine/threonine protein kinase [Gemmataceae bacterium]